jgi:hypothetical protein
LIGTGTFIPPSPSIFDIESVTTIQLLMKTKKKKKKKREGRWRRVVKGDEKLIRLSDDCFRR